jgi:hypothetical protein
MEELLIGGFFFSMTATINIFSFVFIIEEDEFLLHVLRYFLVLGRSTMKFKSPTLLHQIVGLITLTVFY